MGAQASLISADRQEKAEEIEKSMVARFRNEYLAEYRAQHIAVRSLPVPCAFRASRPLWSRGVLRFRISIQKWRQQMACSLAQSTS